ncbi:ASCH domain-containing protein [Lysobacter sp. A421]
MHPSVKLMWREYVACLPDPPENPSDAPPAWHFCANEADANECAQLALSGVKRATSPSLWSFESSGEALPKTGELNIVTDWNGQAICVIRTTNVQILPFNKVTELHTRIEGEGDGSLDWWRKAHWAYYYHELEGSGHEPATDMPIVFQEFERVFPAGAA